MDKCHHRENYEYEWDYMSGQLSHFPCGKTVLVTAIYQVDCLHLALPCAGETRNTSTAYTTMTH